MFKISTVFVKLVFAVPKGRLITYIIIVVIKILYEKVCDLDGSRAKNPTHRSLQPATSRGVSATR